MAVGLVASLGMISGLALRYRARLQLENQEDRAVLRMGLLDVHLLLARLALTVLAALYPSFRMGHVGVIAWPFFAGLSGLGGLLFTLGRITGASRDANHALPALRAAAAAMRLLFLVPAFHEAAGEAQGSGSNPDDEADPSGAAEPAASD